MTKIKCNEPSTMIVKVQLSLCTTHEKRRVLIYNEDRSLRYEGDADPDILEAMGQRAKSYFHAHTHGTVFVLDAKAPWQGW